MAKSPKRKKNRRKGLGIAILVLLLLGAAAAGYLLFLPNTGAFRQGDYFYVPTGSTYADVKAGLKEGGYVRDLTSFDLLAKGVGYPNKVRAGRYQLHRGMSNLGIVRLLRSGKQAPVRITLNKVRRKEDLVAILTKNLEPKATAWEALFADSNALSIHGLDSANVLAIALPDTYEFFWNTTAPKAFGKLAAAYDAYWTRDRTAKAQAIGLTPAQVMVLASIVEEEWARKEDRGPIASVYLNRLKKGMKLQADPTSKWAYGDFTLRRITTAQTSLAHPYNTYYVSGLPPGPICTPIRSTVDAVLDAPKTDYLYFCARADRSGYHDFAATWQEHLKNANRYQQSLDERQIR